MNGPQPAALEDTAERLLSLLAGVISARTVRDEHGRICEIHVLATPEYQPKQVVRNVESALHAGLGIEIDRRIVSVAQMAVETTNGATFHPPGPRPGNGPTPAIRAPARHPEPSAASAARESVFERIAAANRQDSSRRATGATSTAVPESPRARRRAATQAALREKWRGRVVFAGYEAHRASPLQATCTVRLHWNGETVEGRGTGPNTTVGRAQSAARAVFAALAQIPGWDAVGLEGVGVVDAHGRTYVVVSATVHDLRAPIPLAGAAALSGSPEQAAIFASLQATNRWGARPAGS